MDFSGYFESGSGVSDAGYIYVPENCADADSNCRLHIVFHGCRQGAEFIGDRFATASGLNAWAVQNRIVVVYPFHGNQIELVDNVEAVHGWPTLDEGSDCLEMGGDFINAFVQRRALHVR